MESAAATAPKPLAATVPKPFITANQLTAARLVLLPFGDSLPRQPLTDELWVRCIFRPDEEPAISRVFRALCQTVALLKAQPHKQLGLKRKNRTDPHASPLNFCKVFNSVSQAPGVPQPELYFQPEQPFGLALASCEEKGVLIPSFPSLAPSTRSAPRS